MATSFSFTNVSFFVFYIFTNVCSAYSALMGFSTILIHRDSPASPFYDPSMNQTERLDGAIRRSLTRLSHFKRPTAHINATILPSTGENHPMLTPNVGTPPFKQLAIADTGSDITWTQCLPCDDCFKQDQPIFNSENSSTFKLLSCVRISSGYCSRTTETCKYHISYDYDESTTDGVLAIDTYTLGGTSIPNLLYGCSHESQGVYLPDTAGIVGLGGRSISLVDQLRKSIAGMFSYCLLSDHTTGASSKISFGSKAVVAGPGVVSTRLLVVETFYFLTLESISVDGEKSRRIFFKGASKSGQIDEKGNIVIDSGTTMTFLPRIVYQKLEDIMKSVIMADPVPHPKKYLSLCYIVNKDFTAPTITIHFAGGAELTYPWTTTFYMYGNVGCLGFLPTDDIYNIYGNLLQMDFLIGYDLENGVISFKPTDCSKE
ncbi:aspartic proteinase CDR1-like [Impatiens glandulifera]|uniref:aspartic proteinase CDR1-like n=1 Tax=Impatiens glandulifera TaxID=253017 RepID=UPI001FB06A09|nr:aspartic proteinase CDR1-like [Impatiens glandulifera]